jgi:hypothetical protein
MKIFFDQTEPASILFYRVVLIVLTIAVTVGAVILIRYVEQGFWDQGGGLYLTLGLLLFFGWVIGEFVSLARRQKLMSVPPLQFTKTPVSPAQTFTFTRGRQANQSANRAAGRARSDTVTSSKTFSRGVAPAPADTQPTQPQIEQADRLEREGRDWESICALINPKYSGMPSEDKQVYNLLVQTFVAARRAQRGQS